jgi:tetratricopeptide (TPR) repeat protein
MVELTKRIPNLLTRQQVQVFAPAISHVAEVAGDQELRNFISDEDLIWPSSCLGSFYIAQGLYEQAEHWCEQCRSVTRNRFGAEHPAVASSLNNLATLYNFQGRYWEAESLHQEALHSTNASGEEHSAVATALNALASLYHHQGSLQEAEPLYLQAFALTNAFLQEDHPDVAISLNNTALLYSSQGRYSEAERLYLQALELWKRSVGRRPSCCSK